MVKFSILDLKSSHLVQLFVILFRLGKCKIDKILWENKPYMGGGGEKGISSLFTFSNFDGSIYL